MQARAADLDYGFARSRLWVRKLFISAWRNPGNVPLRMVSFLVPMRLFQRWNNALHH